MFDRVPKRLEDADLVFAAIRALHEEGYDRGRIEDALIRQAPVDLDLLAECYGRLQHRLHPVERQERAGRAA